MPYQNESNPDPRKNTSKNTLPVTKSKQPLKGVKQMINGHRIKFAAAIATIGMFLASLAGVAFATPAMAAGVTLHDVLPGGLGHSAHSVRHNAQLLIANDWGVDQAFASDTGISASAIANSNVGSVSRSHCVLGTSSCINTGRTNSGSIEKTSYDDGDRVVVWKVELELSGKTTIVVKLMQSCANLMLHKHGPKPQRHPVTKSKTIEVRIHKSVKVEKKITCPSGQEVNISVVATAGGYAKASAIAKAVEIIKLKVAAAVKVSVKATIHAVCQKYPSAGPVMAVGAKSCVVQGQSNGVIDVEVSNPNLRASKVIVTVGNMTKTIASLGGRKNAALTFNGYAPGTYPVKATLVQFSLSSSTTVTVGQCSSPPPPNQTPPTITGVTVLNDVPAGGSSSNFYTTVNFPDYKGQPGSGSTTWSGIYGSFTTSSITNVPSGTYNNTFVGPDDPTSGTLQDQITIVAKDSNTGLSVTYVSPYFSDNEGAQGGRPGDQHMTEHYVTLVS